MHIVWTATVCAHSPRQQRKISKLIIKFKPHVPGPKTTAIFLSFRKIASRPSRMARSALETGLGADNHPRNMGCHPSGIRMNHFRLGLSSLRHVSRELGSRLMGYAALRKCSCCIAWPMRQKLMLRSFCGPVFAVRKVSYHEGCF